MRLVNLKSHLSLVFLLICGVVLLNNHVNAQEQQMKFSQSATMKFLYCYSCGYKKAFEDYVNILHEKYPEIMISGANYDPPGMNFILSKIILVSKLLLIIAIMSSAEIFQFIGRDTPAWWSWCIENKIYACMMTFFLGNMIEAQLVSSGAFEISLNDVPVWSKLQTGRIPAPGELFQIIESHLQFNDKFDKNPDFVK